MQTVRASYQSFSRCWLYTAQKLCRKQKTWQLVDKIQNPLLSVLSRGKKSQKAEGNLRWISCCTAKHIVTTAIAKFHLVLHLNSIVMTTLTWAAIWKVWSCVQLGKHFQRGRKCNAQNRLTLKDRNWLWFKAQMLPTEQHKFYKQTFCGIH